MGHWLAYTRGCCSRRGPGRAQITWPAALSEMSASGDWQPSRWLNGIDAQTGFFVSTHHWLVLVSVTVVVGAAFALLVPQVAAAVRSLAARVAWPWGVPTGASWHCKEPMPEASRWLHEVNRLDCTHEQLTTAPHSLQTRGHSIDCPGSSSASHLDTAATSC